MSWEKVLRLLVVNRWIEPGSEFRVHRHWFLDSAMDELLGVDFAVAEKDRLYRCLDRLLEHKQDLFVWLRQKWADLFHADFEVLLYDLTSTYFEGEMEDNPKAKRGYSRDGRPDCLQVVIALVVTTDGFPLAYEVMDGNTSDRTTLRGFLDKIENTYGKAKRMWVMDRGIPTEEILAEMRDPARQVSYLVGTPKSKIKQYEQKWLDLPWKKVRDSVDVKLFDKMRRTLRAGQEHRPASQRDRDAAETSGAAVAETAGDAPQLAFTRSTAHAHWRRQNRGGPRVRFCPHRRAEPAQSVTRQSFRFRVDKAKLKAAQLRDGHYLLRSNLTAEDPEVLWTRYVQLTQIESAFRSLKSELRVRPIYHQLEHRADAHILIAFLAYCLQVTLKNRLMTHAPGLTPTSVMEKLATIQMIDVCIPTVDGRWLILPRYTQPDTDTKMLLHKLRIDLPAQPPPRITSPSRLRPRFAPYR